MPTRRTISSASATPSASAPVASTRRKTTETRSSSPFALGVLALVVLVGGYLAITQRLQGRHAEPATGEQAAQMDEDDVAALVKQVSRHILVKNDEVPTIATVQDPDLLRQQSPFFYKDAQNGDRLLVWSDKAVLYSPSRDVLLAVLPVSIPVAPTATSTSTVSTTPTATTTAEVASVEVRNGSNTPGRGKTMATTLKNAGFTVLPATDAKKKTYATSVIVKTSDKELPQTLKKLQETLKAEVIEVPTAEAPFKGDFLVIVGADFQP